MHVILSASAVWVATKDVEVTEKTRTASMMAKNSRVDIVICCGGGAEVLGPATSIRIVVLGAKCSGGAKDVGAMSNGVGTEDART